MNDGSSGIEAIDLLCGVAGALFLAICTVSICALIVVLVRQVTAIEDEEDADRTR